MNFFIKTILSAVIIATASELGKRSSVLAAALIALPLTSILALSFLYLETKDLQKVSDLSYNIFWLVLPTLIFFVALPQLLKYGFDFWTALSISCAGLIILFYGYDCLFRNLGFFKQ